MYMSITSHMVYVRIRIDEVADDTTTTAPDYGFWGLV
jgi:hypothetical protein